LDNELWWLPGSREAKGAHDEGGVSAGAQSIRRTEIGGIVIDLNVERLFFLLTAAFFAFAVARTVHLLFS
jgi:hypothetical protein